MATPEKQKNIEHCHLCGYPMLQEQCINQRCVLFGVGKIVRDYTFRKGGGSLPGSVVSGRGFDMNRLARGFRNIDRMKPKKEKEEEGKK